MTDFQSRVKCPDCDREQEIIITERQFERAKRRWAGTWEPYPDQQNVRSLDDYYRDQSIGETWTHSCTTNDDPRTLTTKWSYDELHAHFGRGKVSRP